MRTKNKDVKIEKLEWFFKLALKSIENACKYHNGSQYVMTITSGNDGKHMKNSLHYKNRAIDIRCKDMLYVEKTVKEIKLALGKSYDVIYEKDHIHIEYDPK